MYKGYTIGLREATFNHLFEKNRASLDSQRWYSPGLFDEFFNFLPALLYFGLRPFSFDNPGDTFSNRAN
jgi:hypothetical protein